MSGLRDCAWPEPRVAPLCARAHTVPVVQDFDMRRTKDIAARVQQIRYENYNHQFLEVVESEMSEEAETKRWMVRQQTLVGGARRALTSPFPPLQQGDVEEGSESGSYGAGQWGVHGNHEAVAMDMGMLGYVDGGMPSTPCATHAVTAVRLCRPPQGVF